VTGADLILRHNEYVASGSTALDPLLDAVRRYAAAIVRDEDLVQTIVVKVWQNLDRFKPQKGSFAGWVRTIASRAQTDAHRANGRAYATDPDAIAAMAEKHRRDEPEPAPMDDRIAALLRGPDQEMLKLMLAGCDTREAGRRMGLTANQADYRWALLKERAQNISGAVA
jgi:RNA polymerase sigma factor (sigma-70 family)